MEAFEEWEHNKVLKSADPVTYDDDGNVIPLSERFNVNEADIRHSRRKPPKFTPSEYGRLQSAWDDDTQRAYQFIVRHNGGIIVDLDRAIVYTDDEGSPQYVLDVGTDDRWSNIDVYNAVIELEKEGKSHEMQRRILKSLFGTEGAHFHTGRERSRFGGENGTGARRDARTLGKGNRSEASEEITDGPDGIEVDNDTSSASHVQSSARTWRGSDYVTKREEMARKLVDSLDVSLSTARKWIDDVSSIYKKGRPEHRTP